MTLTTEQKDLARHALGLSRDRKTSYRNCFVADPGHDDYAAWRAMVYTGHAIHRLRSHVVGGHIFWLTRKGADAALNKGDRLDPEDWEAQQ